MTAIQPIPQTPLSPAKQMRATLVQALRLSTARCGLRLLPDFIIIGTQRGGTTSLFKLLCEHPAIGTPYRKEIHYFDNNFHQPLDWYRSFFSTTMRRRIQEHSTGDYVTGESSPYYMFHPHVPARVGQILPGVKVIVMLRNPVDRALSHYQHSIAHALESLSFNEALDWESKRLANEEQRMLNNPGYYSLSHQNHSYVARGIYVDQLRRWSTHVPADRTLVLQSERFYRDPATVFLEVCRFLGIGEQRVSIPAKHNALAYEDMDRTTRERLLEHFRPHNQRLFEYLGEGFDWDA